MSLPVFKIEAAPLSEHAEQVMVPMRDGVRIATDVYLPDRPGRHPVILSRVPYDKNSDLMAIRHVAPFFTERGYAFVVQDVRGKYRSEGETMPFVHEIDDTYDTLEWLTTRSWCNGAVGMTGDSYHGFTQWAGAAGGHSALKAIAPRVTGIEIGSSSGRGFAQIGNTAQHLVGLYHANYFAHYWVDNAAYAFDVDWSARPLRSAFDLAFEAIGTRSPILDRMFGNTTILDPMAARMPFSARPIPVMHRVGWFDNLLDLSMADYRTQLSHPVWQDDTYLDADACDHFSYHLDHAPVAPEHNQALNPDALQAMLPRYLGRSLDFFDVFVAGTRAASVLDRATWYHGHLGTRTAQSWPPAAARKVRFYPQDGAHATESATGGALSLAPHTDGTPAVWVHDPADPVQTTVVDSFVFLLQYPDESVVHGRHDVVTFSSEPSTEPLDLAGPVRAVVTFESSAPSMDLFVKLCDVSPDGTARMIVRGQRRVFDNGSVIVDMGETGYRLAPGHHLRLQFTSSDFPMYAPHPGTDEDPWLAIAGTKTTQMIRLGPDLTYLALTVLDSI